MKMNKKNKLEKILSSNKIKTKKIILIKYIKNTNRKIFIFLKC